MSDRKKKFRIKEEKRRILLVEDDIVNQEMLKAGLEEVYDLIIAETGEQAMDILRDQYEKLSIILLDLNLPGMSGIEVLRLIKADPAFSRLPVIVMTADSEAEVECLNLGAIDFIPKPYPPSKVVLARIQRIVELSEDRDLLRFTERDHLTGLYNREFFFRYAHQLDRWHGDEPTDAIVFNIDHFRAFNERFGRARGDDILKRIAGKALEAADDAGGIVCRAGADTFMYYCPHPADYEALLDRLSVPLGGGPEDRRIHLRMGVYADADKTADIERRFDRARMAADQVRGNLVDPIGFYDDSMREAEMLAGQLIDDFPAAIQGRQFEVYYQAKYNIRGDEPVLSSAEALVRWNHPELGLTGPGRFVPLFEKNGLVQELDHYVWSETAAQIKSWKERYGITLPVSVNVSRIDLYDPELTDRLLSLVRENGLTAQDLLLEITESAYTDDSQMIASKVEELRGLGFRIELDDFGTGYSSLSMLSYMPVDVLKLDMQFIKSAFSGRMDTRLLEAMIGLAGSFGLPTIAEGVETAGQMATLKELGCDVIQGFWLARPLPAAEFEKQVLLQNK